MATLAERIKSALSKRGLSQAEAAKRCGISQQSINYIINKNLKASKLAAQIASGLQVNPEWLIYGTGKLENPEIYEIPVIHSANMLERFLCGGELDSLTETVLLSQNLGEYVFAYLFASNKLAICSSVEQLPDNLKFIEFLVLKNNQVCVEKGKQSPVGEHFLIYEWRTRNVNF